jgi:hypothetical protein
MNLSSPAPPVSPGFVNQPPVSPGGTASPPVQSIEAQVVRMGLMTPDDVATTMREEAETGRTFAELAVEHGRISADDMARLTEPEPAAPAPAPAAPQPQDATEPTPLEGVTAEVFVRLTSGERIAIGAFDGQSAAEECARELMAALDSEGDWPQIDGRYIRPDAVVSIDVVV